MVRQERLSLVCLVVVGLVAHNVVTSVTSRSLDLSDQKNYYTPQPSHPSPSGGGSSYHGSTPTTPVHDHYHPTPTGGYYHPPTYGSTPVTHPPVTTTPSTPVTTPHSYPTGTCSYWSSHPDIIVAVAGYWGTIEHIFGADCAAIFGKDLSLHDALTNKRDDGYGALVREGTASMLNSMATTKFPYTTQQVKTAFAAALPSDGAAGAQAALFQQANEGKY